jgi:hypothetical protein
MGGGGLVARRGGGDVADGGGPAPGAAGGGRAAAGWGAVPPPALRRRALAAGLAHRVPQLPRQGRRPPPRHRGPRPRLHLQRRQGPEVTNRFPSPVYFVYGRIRGQDRIFHYLVLDGHVMV